MNDMTPAISLMPPPEWDDSVDQTETVGSRLSALRKLEPPQQRRQLLALLQATGSLPRYSREQLEAVMEIDRVWHPIAEELDRDYRRNPLAVTTDPLGFQKGMAALSRAFGDIYAGFARIYSKDPEDAVQGSLKGCIALALFHLGRYARYLYCRNELPAHEFWERMHFL